MLDETVGDALRLDEAADDSLYLVYCLAGPPVDFVVEVTPTATCRASVRLVVADLVTVVLWEPNL